MKNFWDKTAHIYNLFMYQDQKAYQKMYALIRLKVKDKKVLELATGTGLIARNIVDVSNYVDASDSSSKMIEQAKKNNSSTQIHFSVQDMYCLPYLDHSYDVVIIANALHIIDRPQRALQEAKRVLKEDGLLIVPTFTHANNSFFGKVKASFMKKLGFPLYQKWSTQDYLLFLEKQGWKVEKSQVIKASFPLIYVECKKGRE